MNRPTSKFDPISIGLRFAVVAAILFASPRAASGHELRPCLLDINEIAPGRYTIHWSAGAPPPGGEAPAPVFPARCRGAEPTDSGVPRVLDCGAQGLAGATVAVRGLARSRVEAVVHYSAMGGVASTQVLRADSPEFVAPNEAGVRRSAGAVAQEYVRAGVEHILLGWDHLLFVLGLLLLVRPLKPLVRTITAFTVAHSLTLALSVARVVRVPQAPAEALIALSLLLLAAEIARPAEGAPSARGRPWIMAFSFGLLHGFGFAGALSAIGLPSGEIPLALFAFNVGVELGQIAFVIGVLGLVALVNRALPRAAPSASRARRPARPIAYAIGALSAFWFFERLSRLGS